MAADALLDEELRGIAETLRDAYAPPISSHVIARDGTLVRTFVGNTIFDGDSYLEFLEGALEAVAPDDER